MSVCLGILAVIVPVHSQVGTAELVGTVTDASDAALADAGVSVWNPDTGLSRETHTDSGGGYVVPLLPPGAYQVTVEARGFRRLVQSEVRLWVNQRARLDFKLQLGQLSETLSVTGAPPLLESQSSSLGSVLGQGLVNVLPLNGRNFVQLAILSPGVNGTGYSVAGTIMSGTRPDDRRPGSELFANGNREGSNNFLYDGIDDNDRRDLSIVLRPAIEAVREFKVQTNLFGADLGRNTGAVVDVITKSGTNDLHGSVFEFLRNSVMDARNFFNTKGTPFPAFRYNQFGFSLGGPAMLPKAYDGRDHTFFFIDYEGFRRDELLTRTVSVPSAPNRHGEFTLPRIFDPLTTRDNPARPGAFVRTPFVGNVIPASRFDPVTVKLIDAYPVPHTSRSFNNYTSNRIQRQTWNQGDVRVDQQFGSSDTFFARWSIQDTETIVPNYFPPVRIPGLPGPVSLGSEDTFAGTSLTPAQHAAAAYVHLFSPGLINELRIGFNRYVVDYTAEDASPGADLGNRLGIPNANWNADHSVLPIFSPLNFAGIGSSRSLPILRRENTFHYIDNLTWLRGRHTVKFGVNLRRRQITDSQTNDGNGRFNFSPATTGLPGSGNTGNAMASLLLGYSSLIQHDYLLAWVGARGLEEGLFVADNYRITRNLALNLGLRWEYYSPYSEVSDRWANFDVGAATVKLAGRNGIDSRAGVERDLRNYGPRFGFAYQLLANTVIRGGYGLYYNPGGNSSASLRLYRHVPFGPIYTVTPGDLQAGPRVSDGFPPPPAVDLATLENPSGGVIGVDPHFKNSSAQQFNLSLEHEIAPWQILLKAAYVGNLGRRLDTTIDLNQPAPGPTPVDSRRPFFSRRPGLSSITYAVSDGLSNYNAFQLAAEKRLSHGLTLLLGYTWAHATDDVGTESGGGTPTPQDIRNRRADRGNSAFDIRQRLTISYAYRLPFGNHSWLGGWHTAAIVTVQTGLPFTPQLQTPTVNTGGASRPDRIRDGALPSAQRSPAHWFDATAFRAPPPFTYGNAGRDILFGPGRANFDVSLFKDFPVRDVMKLQFRAEAFNVLNTPQFGLPGASIGNPQAVVINTTVGNPRQLQGALRLEF